jgi:undecaprenyl-diphosphatase
MMATASPTYSTLGRGESSVTMRQAGWMGFVQGLALPFRGFSRSGSTISAGMLTGASKERAERFSFALAVVLTPAVVGLEALRLVKAAHEAAAAGTPIDLHASVVSSLLGMVFSFLAGLVALKWLSSWLEQGRWYLFGIYCLVASGVVFYLHHIGY